MRTTLSIDDDVLAAAKELAAIKRQSVGKVISSLVRAALHPASPAPRTCNGVPLLAVRPGARRITSHMVGQLPDRLQ